MQIPPISSMSKASTVAKIGRPMKKLTMGRLLPRLLLGLAPGSLDRARLRDRGLRFFGSGSDFFGSGSAFLLAGSGFGGRRSMPGSRETLLVKRGSALNDGGAVCWNCSSGASTAFDHLARPDELNPLDDHLLPGLEPRLEHAQALVVVDRVDLDDLDLVGRVDDEDARPFLPFQDRLLRDDDGVDVLADRSGWP